VVAIGNSVPAAAVPIIFVACRREIALLIVFGLVVNSATGAACSIAHQTMFADMSSNLMEIPIKRQCRWHRHQQRVYPETHEHASPLH